MQGGWTHHTSHRHSGAALFRISPWAISQPSHAGHQHSYAVYQPHMQGTSPHMQGTRPHLQGTRLDVHQLSHLPPEPSRGQERSVVMQHNAPDMGLHKPATELVQTSVLLPVRDFRNLANRNCKDYSSSSYATKAPLQKRVYSQPTRHVKTTPGVTIESISTEASSPLNRGVALPHERDMASGAAAVTSRLLAVEVPCQNSLLSGSLQRGDNGRSSSTPPPPAPAPNKQRGLQLSYKSSFTSKGRLQPVIQLC